MKVKDDEFVLVVCNPLTADYIIQNAPEIKHSLVVTEILETGKIVVIPLQEFLDYLDGKE